MPMKAYDLSLRVMVLATHKGITAPIPPLTEGAKVLLGGDQIKQLTRNDLSMLGTGPDVETMPCIDTILEWRRRKLIGL